VSKDFQAVAGRVTAEAITQPSWLLRNLVDSGKSLTSPYDAVCTLVQISDTECELRGYISHTKTITGELRKSLQEIAKTLGFKKLTYERMDSQGGIRITHSTEVI
jgi:hypothetical protein